MFKNLYLSHSYNMLLRLNVTDGGNRRSIFMIVKLQFLLTFHSTLMIALIKACPSTR